MRISKSKAEEPASTGSQHGITLGRIHTIKAKVYEEYQKNNETLPSISLSPDTLNKAWESYTTSLFEKKVIQNKTVFSDSALRFEDKLIIIQTRLIGLDILKAQRFNLLDYMKDYFRNKDLNVVFEEKKEVPAQPNEKIMSQREIFDMMASKNPLLKRLRDSLNLDLEL